MHRRSLWVVLVALGAGLGCDATSVGAPDLNPPFLVQPEDAQAVPLGNPVTFSWEPVPDAARYEYRVTRSEDEERFRMMHRTNATHFSSAFDRPGVYSWQVRALDAEGAEGLWSEPASFVVQPPATDG